MGEGVVEGELNSEKLRLEIEGLRADLRNRSKPLLRSSIFWTTALAPVLAAIFSGTTLWYSQFSESARRELESIVAATELSRSNKVKIDLEVSEKTGTVRKLNERLAELSAALGERESMISSLKSKGGLLEAELAVRQVALDEMRSNLSQAGEERLALQSLIETSTSEIADLNARGGKLQSDLSETQATLKQARADLATVQIDTREKTREQCAKWGMFN